VLDSGVEEDLETWPHEQLAIVDMSATVTSVESAVTLRELKRRPNNSSFAFLKQVARQYPGPDDLLWTFSSPYGWIAKYRLAFADKAGHSLQIGGDSSPFVLPDSFEWAPDGSKFAFIEVPHYGNAGGFRVFGGVVGGATRPLSMPTELEPQQLLWMNNDALLCRAEHVSGTTASAKRRADWWLLTASGAPRNLTRELPTPPDELEPLMSGRWIVGVANGDVWRLDPPTLTWVNLTVDFAPVITHFATTSGTHPEAVNRDHTIAVSVLIDGKEVHFILDVVSGDMKSLARQAESATLSAYQAESGLAVLAAVTPTGSTLTVVQGDREQQIADANRFLREVASGTLQRIEYHSLDGADLKAWILLPPGYQPNRRYALVAWVYPGWVADDIQPTIWGNVDDNDPMNVQLLAARDYVVLLPSMPLHPSGLHRGDPYLELCKGVLPAVDRVIEMGIADPRRLAVMGHSFGGFGAYGLITQTNRFQAAVVIAGISDLASLYGEIDPRSRYRPTLRENIRTAFPEQTIAETGQILMGNPPWKDVGRYLRNSPLFYVDRVQTPVLIVQGDIDFVPMSQGEQFFTALHRLGRRARFIRYWGEGHIPSSPANIVDMWTRLYGWLDEYLSASPQESSTAPSPTHRRQQ
jgi:acetyl esterase/lipase